MEIYKYKGKNKGPQINISFCVCCSGPYVSIFFFSTFLEEEEDFRLSRHQEQLTVHTVFSLPSNFFFLSFGGRDFGYSSSFLADRRRNHIRLCLSREPSPFFIYYSVLYFSPISLKRFFAVPLKKETKRDTFLFFCPPDIFII